MWEYTDRVKEHSLTPRNVGEVENPDGVAEVGSIACGDALKLSFSLDQNRRIKEAKFKTFGCANAIASSSALKEMIKGMNLEEAAKVTNQDIAAYPGGLPNEKIHCSVMGKEALERETRPSLKHDGGDNELIDVIGNRVIVAVRGACVSCNASDILSNTLSKRDSGNWCRLSSPSSR